MMKTSRHGLWKRRSTAYKQGGQETEAKRLLNTLQSRYPEYSQRKKL